MIFYVYVDWTLEIVPRPFYVGKGTLNRVHKRERNAYWKNITAKYGRRREVVLATQDESFAFEEEKRRIAKLGTFENGEPGRWGANLTEGGEGASGTKHTQTWILNHSGENHPFYGKNHTNEFREFMRQRMTGEKHPQSKLMWQLVEQIRVRYQASYQMVSSRKWAIGPDMIQKLAEEYGVSRVRS